jgi:hypothetical protein
LRRTLRRMEETARTICRGRNPFYSTRNRVVASLLFRHD